MDLPDGMRSLVETDAERAAIAAELQRITEVLVAFGAERVILFGSRAKGEATRESDADLLVVIDGPPDEPWGARHTRLLRAVAPRIRIDLVAYTPDEFRTLMRTREFVREAVLTGRALNG